MPLNRSDFTTIKRLRASEDGAMNAGILLARNRRNGSKCIEKRVEKQSIKDGYAQREIKAMKLCSHRNICAIIAHDLEYRSTGYGSIFIECCELGSLENMVMKFAERRVDIPEGFLWKVLWDMSLALCYLQTGVDAETRARHGENVYQSEKKEGWNEIVHRDIKPANLFLTFRGAQTQYPTVVLGDFGCSITANDMRSRRMTAFTIAFEPPEAPHFSDASDIYSTALNVHCMAKLKDIPSSDSSRVRRDPLGAAPYSSVLGQLLRRCLKKEYKDRPDAMYLPYLVWREMQEAKKVRGGNSKANSALPEWATS